MEYYSSERKVPYHSIRGNAPPPGTGRPYQYPDCPDGADEVAGEEVGRTDAVRHRAVAASRASAG
jgi:hypothetical protein